MVVVFVPALSVNPQGPQHIPIFFRMAKDRAPVPVASQRLGGEKGGAAEPPKGARLFAPQLRPHGLGRILDEQ